MNISFKYAALTLLAGVSFAQAHPENVPHFKDCGKAGEWVASQYAADASSVTELVKKAVRANPDCSCEIVKSAISASEASTSEVAAIVEAVALEVPSQMATAAQCAVSVAPDAADAVSAVVAKYDPSLAANPLDFPTGGKKVEVGPTPGSPGGSVYLPQFFPFQPPFVDTNPATDNDRN